MLLPGAGGGPNTDSHDANNPDLPPNALRLLNDLITMPVSFDAMPTACPHRDDATPCCVVAHGTYTGPRVLTASGVYRARVQRVRCKTHGAVWTPLRATHVSTRSCTGDILHGCILDGNYWPRAFRLWQDTEDMLVLERDLRDATADRLCVSLARHSLRPSLSAVAQATLVQALTQFLLETPTRQLLKEILCDYMTSAVAPRVHALAQPLVATQGALLNMDFSACDARQLRPRRRRRALGETRPRQTFGGVTGLDDCLLLPPLLTSGEDGTTKHRLLQECMQLLGFFDPSGFCAHVSHFLSRSPRSQPFFPW